MALPSLLIRGQPATNTQLNAIKQTLKACSDNNAPTQAVLAILYAGIAESSFNPSAHNAGSGASGVFQLIPSTAQATGLDPQDTYHCAQYWLRTGFYSYGGGIEIVKKYPSWSTEKVAEAVEGPGWGAYAAEAGSNLFLPEAQAIMSAYGAGTLPLNGKGGTSSNGGTGSAGFSVGESSNPDEDFFTAVSRMSQEVNWYIFTRADAGPWLFLADGYYLVNKDPEATIDRIKDADRILALNGTWDNTAFQYRSQRHLKGKVQHKSRVASISSPTECQLTLICNIDEFNPGDMIRLTSCGPANGMWLVAEVQRSIFSISSDLTLVPPIMPVTTNMPGSTTTIDTTNNVNTTTGTQTGGAGGGGGQTGSVNANGYANPVQHIQNLTAERIDMGVDYSGTGSLVAMGDGVITNVYNSGWPGGTFIGLKFTSGTYKDLIMYYAEDIKPSVSVGQRVKAGETIGQMYNGGSGIEIGWSSDGIGTALAAHLGQIPSAGDAGGWSTACGVSMSDFIKACGGPPGKMQAGGMHGTIPAGYPGSGGHSGGGSTGGGYTPTGPGRLGPNG